MSSFIDPQVLRLKLALQKSGKIDANGNVTETRSMVDLTNYVPLAPVPTHSVPLKSGHNYATLAPAALRSHWAQQAELGFYPDFPVEHTWQVVDRLAMQRLTDKRVLYSSGHVILDDKDNGDIIPVSFTDITRKLLNLCFDVKRIEARSGIVTYYIDILGTYPIDKSSENTHVVNLNRFLYQLYAPTVSRSGITMGKSRSIGLTDMGRIMLTGMNPCDLAIMLWDSMREINPAHMSFTVEMIGRFRPHQLLGWLLLQEQRQILADERKAYRSRIRSRFTSNLKTTNQLRQERKNAQLQKLRQAGDVAMFNMVAAQPLHTF